MRYAITPKGISKKPGARAIEDHFPFAPGETFTVSEGGYNPALVLAEDEISLRAKTQGEIDAEIAATAAAVVEQGGQAALAADARADAIFTALQTATPAQIATFVSTRFPAFDAAQRAVMRLLLQVAALTLRRGG